MKTVGIKELKNNLSAYIREVRLGTRILVSDRQTVVAELHEPGASYVVGHEDPLLAEWIEHRVLIPPLRAKQPLPAPLLRSTEGTAAKLLDSDRGEGHHEEDER